MSRLVRKPLAIPSGVTVTVTEGRVSIKGPKGELHRTIPTDVIIESTSEGCVLSVADLNDHRQRSLLGLYRRLLEGMVKGVVEGYERVLEIQGIGYKAVVESREMVLEIGYSHSVRVPIPQGLEVGVEKNIIHVRGIDKEQVGSFTVMIHDLRPPEPYKGKGIRFEGEIVRRKAGKAAKTATAA